MGSCVPGSAVVANMVPAGSGNAEEILGRILGTLNDGSKDWLLTERPFEGVLDTAVSQVCKTLGLSTSDLMSLKIAIMSFAAIAESGVSLAFLVTKLAELRTEVDQINSAMSFLKQGNTHMRIGNIKRAVEMLDKVNTKATEALNCSGTESIEDMVLSTRLLILVDILLESWLGTSTGTPMVPIKSLSDVQRENIAKHAASHVETLVQKIQTKNLPLGGLMKGFTVSYEKKNNLEYIYGSCSQWLTPHYFIVEEDTIQVTLPSLKFIPDGNKHSVTPLRITEPNGAAQHTLSLWTELEDRGHLLLHMGLFGTIYKASVVLTQDDVTVNDETEVVATIKGKAVVAVSTDFLLLDRPVDLTKYDMSWPPKYLAAMAQGASAGDVTTVEELSLYCRNEEKYSMDDIDHAIQILPLVKKAWITLVNLPDSMEVEQWRAAADSAANMDYISIRGRAGVNDNYVGCDEEVGRLITRAKKAVLENVVFYDFDRFIQGVLWGLGEEGAKCEEMSFEWYSTPNHEDKMQEMVDRLGWTNRETDGGNFEFVKN